MNARVPSGARHGPFRSCFRAPPRNQVDDLDVGRAGGELLATQRPECLSVRDKHNALVSRRAMQPVEVLQDHGALLGAESRLVRLGRL